MVIRRSVHVLSNILGYLVYTSEAGVERFSGDPTSLSGNKMVDYLGNHCSMTGAGSQWAPTYEDFWIRHYTFCVGVFEHVCMLLSKICYVDINRDIYTVLISVKTEITISVIVFQV